MTPAGRRSLGAADALGALGGVPGVEVIVRDTEAVCARQDPEGHGCMPDREYGRLGLNWEGAQPPESALDNGADPD